jgi:glyoxalase family protein
MAHATAFSIGASSLDYWMERLAELHPDFDAPVARFGQQALVLRDPDGLVLELVAGEDSAALRSSEVEESWDGGPVPAEHRIRGFEGATLCVAAFEPTAKLLNGTFGYEPAGEEPGRLRFRSPSGGPAAVVDLTRPSDSSAQGRMGAGTVHHVAFRAADEEQQLAWRQAVADLGLNVTAVLDRHYFHSIYFREPGGVLFEIATDGPGFMADEGFDELGSHLKLPPWLEAQREHIERRLPPVSLKRSTAKRI